MIKKHVMIGLLIGQFLGLQASEDPVLALDQAIQEGKIDSVRHFLGQGVDLKRTNKEDLTPLLQAIKQNNVAIFKELVKAGADLKYEYQCKSLIYSRLSMNPISFAITQGSCNVIEVLPDVGVDINAVNRHQRTLLHEAAVSGNTEMIQKLYDIGALIDQKNRSGHTPLYYAVNAHRINNAILLLKLGADTTIATTESVKVLRQTKGSTPLKVCVQDAARSGSADTEVMSTMFALLATSAHIMIGDFVV